MSVLNDMLVYNSKRPPKSVGRYISNCTGVDYAKLKVALVDENERDLQTLLYRAGAKNTRLFLHWTQAGLPYVMPGSEDGSIEKPVPLVTKSSVSKSEIQDLAYRLSTNDLDVTQKRAEMDKLFRPGFSDQRPMKVTDGYSFIPETGTLRVRTLDDLEVYESTLHAKVTDHERSLDVRITVAITPDNTPQMVKIQYWVGTKNAMYPFLEFGSDTELDREEIKEQRTGSYHDIFPHGQVLVRRTTNGPKMWGYVEKADLWDPLNRNDPTGLLEGIHSKIGLVTTFSGDVQRDVWGSEHIFYPDLSIGQLVERSMRLNEGSIERFAHHTWLNGEWLEFDEMED